MTHSTDYPKPPVPSEVSQPAEKTVASRDLFQGQTEIFIDHEGERYRLRITRRNKLILQK